MRHSRSSFSGFTLLLLLWLGAALGVDCQPVDTGPGCDSSNCTAVPGSEPPSRVTSLTVCVRSAAKPFIFPKNSTHADELLADHVAELSLREFAVVFQGLDVDLLLAITMYVYLPMPHAVRTVSTNKRHNIRG